MPSVTQLARSSKYDIYNNLLHAGGLKLREGFRRRAWNNITINNGLHPHAWYNNSGDEVYGNIFMATPRGARMPSENAKGKRVDGNFYFSHDPKIKDQLTTFELYKIQKDWKERKTTSLVS